jgi:hypothetical protein|tara:strand:- start:54006 stop:54242 length:237 start_codon:yes stop_codon:yes gene_type:complete
MKQLAIIFSAVFLTAACTPQSSDNGGGVLLNPVRVYEVDGWGSNPDIYEFTPVGHPEKSCLILVSGGDKASGLTCFDK